MKDNFVVLSIDKYEELQSQLQLYKDLYSRAAREVGKVFQPGGMLPAKEFGLLAGDCIFEAVPKLAEKYLELQEELRAFHDAEIDYDR